MKHTHVVIDPQGELDRKTCRISPGSKPGTVLAEFFDPADLKGAVTADLRSKELPAGMVKPLSPDLRTEMERQYPGLTADVEKAAEPV